MVPKIEVRYLPLHLLVSVFAVFLFLFIPQAFADSGREFSVSISESVLDSLDTAGKAFLSTSEQPRMALQLPTESGSVTAWLEPHDIRSSNYAAWVTGENGPEPDPVQVQLFKAADVQKDKKDFYRFALIKNPTTGSRFLHGHFRTAGIYYRLAPSENVSLEYTVDALTDAEVAEMVARCGMPNNAEHVHGPSSHGVHLPKQNVGISAVRVAEIATDADFEFFQRSGANTNAEILSILNGVEAIYLNTFEVDFQVVSQNVWTVANDPYTSSDAGTLLDQFVAHWRANFEDSINYDLAHLWTGRELDGSTIGIAFLSAVCTNFRYGLSQFLDQAAVDVPLVAHELGHNFGANHDTSGCGNGSRQIMCPSLNFDANVFSTPSQNSINSFLSTANCLAEGGGGGGGGGSNPPVLAPIGPQEVTEGGTLSLTLSASDVDGGVPVATASGLPQGASFSSPTFTYTPALGTVPTGQTQTTVSVTFTLTDSTNLSDSETVVITVLAAGGGNSAPSISTPAAQSLAEGQLLNLQIQATDPNGDAIEFSASNLPAGAMLNSSTGVFSWRPAGNQAGNYSIQITVSDPSNASASATLSVAVSDDPNVSPLPNAHAQGDFNGDGSADLSVFRSITGQWFSNDAQQNNLANLAIQQFGLPKDVPVPADYNGDRVTDYAVFRPSSNTWFITYSGTGIVESIAFGAASDLPVAGADFDNDGRDDIAVYRSASGLFIYRSSQSGDDVVVSVGQGGDIPVPCNFNGTGGDDVAVYRPTTSSFITQNDTVEFGALGDIPVPADFDGDGQCEYAVWRPTTGEWLIRDGETIQFGLGGDVPVAADFDGDGSEDIAVFRTREANWYIRGENQNLSIFQLGLPSDILPLLEARYFAMRNSGTNPVAARGTDASTALLFSVTTQVLYTVGSTSLVGDRIGALPGSHFVRGDYDGDGQLDTAVFSSGVWSVFLASGGLQSHLWGTAGDIPVAADFDGDGQSDIAVYRPNDGSGFSVWYAIRSSNGLAAIYNWGLPGDVPVAGDFNGDGWSDPAVWRPGPAVWYVLDGRSGAPLEAVQWGIGTDTPRVADFDGDGRTDKVVWRSSTGTWFVRHSGGSQIGVPWGLPGDVPVQGSYIDGTNVDYAVFRPSDLTLYILPQNSAAGFARPTGLPGVQVVGVAPSAPVQ